MLETLDTKKIGSSVDKLKNIPDPGSVAFDDVARILNVYLLALSDSSLKISTSEPAYSDMKSLFFPSYINHFSSREHNFKQYKALLVPQWAKIVFSTWSINLEENIKSYSDQKRALRLFHALETMRLDACIKRELHGMSRTMTIFRVAPEHPQQLWKQTVIQLQHPKATVLTTLACFSRGSHRNEASGNTPLLHHNRYRCTRIYTTYVWRKRFFHYQPGRTAARKNCTYKP